METENKDAKYLVFKHLNHSPHGIQVLHNSVNLPNVVSAQISSYPTLFSLFVPLTTREYFFIVCLP